MSELVVNDDKEWSIDARDFELSLKERRTKWQLRT